jgi:Flp pilus assembly protein TadD
MMATPKFLHYLRRPAIAAVVVASLFLAVAVGVPGVRSRISANLDAGANLFLFDGDEPQESGQAEGKKPNSMKRIVSAPVRFVARLFKKKDDSLAMKKLNEKDIEKMKIVPLNRSQNGTPGQIADANGHAAEATTAEVAAQNLFEEAVALHDKSRLDGAIEKLVAATVLQPNFSEAFNLLAVCYDEKGQYRSAQEEYKKALKIESNNARFLNNLGYSYYLAQDYGNAIKWYGKGLKVTPNDRRMHNNIGLAYGRKGDYDKAKGHFVTAVGETGAHLNLGYVYSQQGRIDDAIKHYETALRAQPQSLPALSNLAQLYERSGRIREAAVLSEQYKKLTVSAQQKDQTVDQEQ